ncbi:MAG: carbonic anhydrase [bacterium]
MDPNSALERLLEGNARLVSNQSQHCNQSEEIRRSLMGGQKPFAAILCCSDSRVPPELIFDQGFGDLFVIRVAGNVLSKVNLCSLEYAVGHLGVNLIMILGHQNCGAIKASMENTEPIENNELLLALEPAVQEAKKAGSDDLWDRAVRANLAHIEKLMLAGDHHIKSQIDSGQCRIVSAYYHLDSGRVDVL